MVVKEKSSDGVAVFRQMPNCTKTECVFVVGFPSRGVTGVLGDGNRTAIWNNTGYDSWNMGAAARKVPWEDRCTERKNCIMKGRS